MAQAVKKGLKFFCMFGGPWVAPFVMPCINVLCLLCCFLPSLSSAIMSGPNPINHNSNNPDPNSKDWGRASAWVFAFYYIISLLFFCAVMQMVCKVNDNLPDSG
jgi:hypothetical protein